MAEEIKLTKPYELLLKELERKFYETWTVFDYFIKEKDNHPRNKVNAILRIDVDLGLHLCLPLARILQRRSINASFYFLTFPDTYYNIWKSDIPKRISDMGFEVGLHTDHYYRQLIYGEDAIEGIKRDIKKLSELIGKPVYGMVYHGHERINALGRTNRDVYKDLRPEELGLAYHDGYRSHYTKSNSDIWQPNTDHPVLTDFMAGVVGAWRYCSSYPVKILHGVKIGESIHVCIHPHNVFEKWWQNWDYSYDEKMPVRGSSSESLINFGRVWFLLVRTRLRLKKLRKM